MNQLSFLKQENNKLLNDILHFLAINDYYCQKM